MQSRNQRDGRYAGWCLNNKANSNVKRHRRASWFAEKYLGVKPLKKVKE